MLSVPCWPAYDAFPLWHCLFYAGCSRATSDCLHTFPAWKLSRHYTFWHLITPCGKTMITKGVGKRDWLCVIVSLCIFFLFVFVFLFTKKLKRGRNVIFEKMDHALCANAQSLLTWRLIANPIWHDKLLREKDSLKNKQKDKSCSFVDENTAGEWEMKFAECLCVQIEWVTLVGESFSDIVNTNTTLDVNNKSFSLFVLFCCI